MWRRWVPRCRRVPRHCHAAAATQPGQCPRRPASACLACRLKPCDPSACACLRCCLPPSRHCRWRRRFIASRCALGGVVTRLEHHVHAPAKWEHTCACARLVHIPSRPLGMRCHWSFCRFRLRCRCRCRCRHVACAMAPAAAWLTSLVGAALACCLPQVFKGGLSKAGMEEGIQLRCVRKARRRARVEGPRREAAHTTLALRA